MKKKMSTYFPQFSVQPSLPIFTFEEVQRIFAVSIVPVGWSGFTRIRLLFVRPKDDASLSNILIRPCTHPKVNSPSVREPPLRHREILARHQSARTKKATVPSSFLPTNADTQVLSVTIVYGIFRANNSYVQLVPRQLTSPLNPDKIAVVYDHASLLDPQNSALYLHFESTIPLLPDSTFFDYKTFIMNGYHRKTDHNGEQRKIPSTMHVVRILPRKPKDPVLLPPRVMRVIALFVIDWGRTRPSWRKDLLNLGLTNKSWSPVLDLFFEVHDSLRSEQSNYSFGGGDPSEVRPALMAVARSLFAGRPERALLMNEFSLFNYRDPEEDPYHIGHSEAPFAAAINYVLAHARNLKRVKLELEYVQFPEIFSALSRLDSVERVSLSAGFGQKPQTAISMATLQQTMMGWPSLSQLDVDGPGTSVIEEAPAGEASKSHVTTAITMVRKTHPTYLPFPESDHLNLKLAQIASSVGSYAQDATDPQEEFLENMTRFPCTLATLRLRLYALTSLQFLKFFDVDRPRMQVLELINVSGITNSDLHTALKSMTDSLTTITIVDCGIVKSSDEEHALDAIIPGLMHLERLLLTTHHFSWLSVKRKTRQFTKRPPALSVIHVKDVSSVLARLPDALKESRGTWESITVTTGMSYSLTPADNSAIRTSEIAASTSDIRFHFVGPYRLF